MDRQFTREPQFIYLCRYMYIDTTFSGSLRQTAVSKCKNISLCRTLN